MCEEIRIYVADLAAYNNGKLHGCWIDATQALDDIWDQVNEMLKNSPEDDAEEWAIHDYEGFEGVYISEYEGFESAHKKALFIDEHGTLGAKVLEHWCGDIEEAQKALDDSYSGEYESLEDYARGLTEDTSEVPEHIAFYIDYQSMGRDIELNGDIYTIETAFDEIHVFWSH